MSWIVIVVIVLAAVVVAGFLIVGLAGLFRKAHGILNTAGDLVGEIKDAQVREQETPKSLNAMDSLLFPQVMRDFPEYSREIIENRVRRDAKLYYESGLKGRCLLNDGVAFSLRDEMKLPEDVAGGVIVHRIALTAYDRRGRDKVITYQAAVQYDGTDGVHHQKRLVLKYMAAYTADPTDNIEVIKCPNCGAPVPTMGEKTCSYCGASLVAHAGAGWTLIKLSEE